MNPSLIRNKKFDLAGQILIPVLLLMLYLTGIVRESVQAVGSGYFILGGWQLISSLVHLSVQRALWSSARKLYNWLLIATIIVPIIIVVVDNDSFITVGLVVLGWTAIMAVYYLVMSIIEHNKWKSLEIEQLQNAFNEESDETH
ncbi:MAG: hypothetical protein K2P88_08955 [Chitinophagaceae bacterium]|uniref:hypothetical protein n=1 Tax=unclassified Paraflavitalea TaxID=2798305 RepID=UPI003D32A174|nr:hypothetical protein [Chitinophagaceae bacterium]